MKTDCVNKKTEYKTGLTLIWKCILALMIVVSTGCNSTALAEPQTGAENNSTKAKVIGLRYNNVHVLNLEETLELYLDILGFELVDAEVLKGGLAGMLVLKVKANDYMMTLTVTPPQDRHRLGPVGNTNHNHFMLRVNDIGPIGDRLKEEGYELENDNYVQDTYTFFKGPNGEIIGLSSWKGS
ncbi:VOC family protein [Paraglaciecola chathamensis]|uniref:VOC domain-containing protein n=1 Tax=Paraglaciecola agarilytica NO2 TaxID=1125747 RepID=A0ABQ0IE72_9ALTE|nr:VOC family protein [Paraglaciecola agarilytica]GAC07573.1 hypothetical protein GAGA_4749 [Paraglaciecola agarilytica NO2]